MAFGLGDKYSKVLTGKPRTAEGQVALSGPTKPAPPNTHQQNAIALTVNRTLSTYHLALKRRCDMESAYKYAGLVTQR